MRTFSANVRKYANKKRLIAHLRPHMRIMRGNSIPPAACFSIAMPSLLPLMYICNYLYTFLKTHTRSLSVSVIFL